MPSDSLALRLAAQLLYAIGQRQATPAEGALVGLALQLLWEELRAALPGEAQPSLPSAAEEAKIIREYLRGGGDARHRSADAARGDRG